MDSHVFSNVVFDRAAGGSVLRMMPSPFDVAFAALGNNHALELLVPELERYSYAPDLGAKRVLADEHPPEFWQANLYNRWLGSLRTLAPNAAPSDSNPGLPPVAKSALWGKRLLATELASWAELRHDTILYAKQSYTGGNSCEFPDAYVDPYRNFYAKLGEYAAFGQTLADELAKGPRGADIVWLASSYYEKVTENFERLTDPQWAASVYNQTDPAWLSDVVK